MNRTGNIRYRTNWRGQLIVQIEWLFHKLDLHGFSEDVVVWRDAQVTDLEVLK